jgi:hypothetical protein
MCWSALNQKAESATSKTGEPTETEAVPVATHFVNRNPRYNAMFVS